MTYNPIRAWKNSFTHRVETAQDRASAETYLKWLDAGFLRIKWRNQWEIAQGVYRSNNPNPARFAELEPLGLRTIVDLRNDSDRSPSQLVAWECKERGITYLNRPFSQREAPSRDQLVALIEEMPNWEKPLLIHCKSGADRTGLVAAIWQLTQEKRPLDEARKQLSAAYLHIREGHTGVLDEVLDQYAEAGEGVDFLTWVKTAYDPDIAVAAYRLRAAQSSLWDQIKALVSTLYKHGQACEAKWHQSFEAETYAPHEIERARFFVKWIDHGFLRDIWTNEVEIFPGVMRTNHPTDKRFRKYAADGLQTVINLRGEVRQPQHYFEVELCKELGLTLLDVPIDSHRAPTRAEVQAVIEAIETAEKPLIFHCKSGADRTGLVAALYVLYKGGTIADARAQLSAKYLHFRRGRKAVLDEVIDAYERDYLASGTAFPEWLSERYDPSLVIPGKR